MSTVDDLTKKEVIKAFEHLLQKMKPNGQILEAEFDLLLITLAKEKQQPTVVLRQP